MAEVAPNPVAATAPAKASRKKPTSKTKRAGPSVGELIAKAVTASNERNGISLAALKKALAADGYDVDSNSHRVRFAVKNLVTKGTLVQLKGTGASGSFKFNKKKEVTKKPVKKVASKVKKPVAKKAPPTKKPKKVVTKKPTPKKTPKKPKGPAVAAKKASSKSPKTLKKAAAAKKLKKSPKKAKTKTAKTRKPLKKK